MTPQLAVAAHDVILHKPVQEREAERARQFRQRLLEVSAGPDDLSGVRQRFSFRNRPGLQQPKSLRIVRPLDIHGLSDGGFHLFHQPRQCEDFTLFQHGSSLIFFRQELIR